MIKDDKRIRIITGHYGSGKTEFAVNYAMNLIEVSEKKVAIADMDIVNLYFRSRERRKELEDKGIRVIFSSLKNDAIDVPAIDAGLVTPIKDKSYDYIIDLGGNDVGTKVFGRYKGVIDPKETDFFMVININRPDTSTVEKIIEQKNQLEYSSGLAVTGFINNTNLVRESTLENILLGDKIISKVSRDTGIPVKYITYVEEVLRDMTPEIASGLSGEVLPLKFYMRETWM